MSDTPRTDALQNTMIEERQEVEARTAEHPSLFFMDEHIERSLEHARNLERELAASRDDASMADTKRLDWLDARNAALNNHYGTNYGWRLILSPNVVRLMRDGHASVSGYLTDIDLHDSEGGTRKARSCRDAIDAAMKASKSGIHQGSEKG